MDATVTTGVPYGRPWSFRVSPFDGSVYCNVFAKAVEEDSTKLWTPRTEHDRWNRDGIPTLYTSRSLDVSLAERVKSAFGAAIRVVVGVARIRVQRAVDLTDPADGAACD